MAVVTLGKRHVTRPLFVSAAPAVLVVDSDADMMRIIMHTLAVAGYRARPARGAVEALRQVHRAQPDLVVTSLAMPEVSGVDLISRLRRDPETAAIPILALADARSHDAVRAAAEAGCNGFVGKPLNGPQLLHEVEQAIAQSRVPFMSDAGAHSGPPDLCA